MKRWFTMIMVFTLLILAQACSSNVGGITPQTTRPGESTPGMAKSTAAASEPTQPVSTPTSEAEFASLSDYAMTTRLVVSPEVVGAGETIELTSSFTFTGTLQIQGPQASGLSVDMKAGKAQLELPEDIPAGLYTVELNGQANRYGFGTFRVADQPGIWLTIDRSFVRPGEAPRIHVSAWGVPEDLPVEVDVHGSLFALNQLGPDSQTGQLIPFRLDQPPQLGDLLGRTWTLPEGISGDIEVVAGNDSSSDSSDFSSNTMRVSACSSPSYIQGDLGVSGQIRAIWAEGGARVVSAETQDGSFQLEAGPGLVLLDVQRTDNGTGGARSSQAVRLGCGDTVDVGAADLNLKTSLEKGYPFLGLTLDDLGAYTATSTGDLVFNHQGYATCDLTDSTFTVSLDPGSDTPILYRLEAPGVSGNGEYQAVFSLTETFKGDSSGPGTIKIVMDQVDKMMGVKGTFSASYGGKAGSGQISGDFSCFYIPPMASSLQFERNSFAQTVSPKKSLAALSLAAQAQSASNETCRVGIVAYPDDGISPILGEVLATTLFKTTPRLSILTTADIQALLGLQAERLLLGASDADVQAAIDAIAGSMGADYSFWLRMDQLDGQYVLNISAIRVRDARVVARGSRSGSNLEKVAFSDLYQEIAAKMQKADICGKVDPEKLVLNHGQEAGIDFALTDLRGEEVNGAQVTTNLSKCGNLDPVPGTDQCR